MSEFGAIADDPVSMELVEFMLSNAADRHQVCALVRHELAFVLHSRHEQSPCPPRVTFVAFLPRGGRIGLIRALTISRPRTSIPKHFSTKTALCRCENIEKPPVTAAVPPCSFESFV